MSLSNSITTLLIDPRSSNNTRTEFRLDDDFYSSTLKLIDVGVFSTEVAGENGGAKICTYPQVNGVYQCIRNIYLYSGSTLIDSVQNCAEYSAIQALKTNNQGSTDLNRDLILNGMGFQQSAVNPDLANYALRRPGSLATTLAKSAKQCASHGTAQVANNQSLIAVEQDAQSGSVNLGVFLQFLKSVSVLPRIPDIRILIEWDTTLSNYFDQANTMTGPLQVIRPTLVVERIDNMPMESQNLSFPYMSTIVERFNVPSTFNTITTVIPNNAMVTTSNSKEVTVALNSSLGLRPNEPIIFQGATTIPRTEMDAPANPVTVTATANSDVVITMVAHGFVVDDIAILSGALDGTIGGGANGALITLINLPAGNKVTAVTTDTFTFASTLTPDGANLTGGGAAIKINGDLVNEVKINGNRGFTVDTLNAAGTSFIFKLKDPTPVSPVASVSSGGGAAISLTHHANRQAAQQSSFRSQAFTEKFVRELVFYNSTTARLPDLQRYVTAKTRSPAQLNERLQLVVNNRNHLPDQGISSEAMRVMYLNSAQSNMNIPYICMLEDTGDQRGAFAQGVGATPEQSADKYEFIYPDGALKNNFSITAAKLGVRIENLRIEHQREYGSKAVSRDPYTLLVFGTVARTMTVQNGQVSIAY